MTTYRLYWIDDAGHVIAQSAAFEARNDDRARWHAEGQAERDHVELWSGLRRVATINPKPMPRLRA